MPVTAMSLTLATAVALVIVSLSDGLVAVLDAPDWRYVIITSLTLGLATLVSRLGKQTGRQF